MEGELPEGWTTLQHEGETFYGVLRVRTRLARARAG